MKIINVTPGLIPIPPNGWGAIEKIIWETHKNLLVEGHDSHIMYLDDVPEDTDIVHIHVANLANMAHERGVPYYFTLHDHHAYLYGKNSQLYQENLKAMKNAIKAFVPAKYLVDYFEGIPEYFSHGVNSLYFTASAQRPIHKLLCVANNGYAYNQSTDRKGFGIAIEAAQKLGLPITIAGPSNNKNYFEKHPPTYDKLTIVYDLNEEELLEAYRSHSIFIHPSEVEAGHPNLTLLEALSCGLPVVGTFESNNTLEGMKVIERNIDSVVQGILDVIQDYETYKVSARTQAEKLDWNKRTKNLLSIYSQNELSTMKTQLLHHYTNTPILKNPPIPKFNFNCIDGMFAEVLGGPETTYSVKFIDRKTNAVEYETEIGHNHWAKPNIKYHVDWRVELTNKNTGKIVTYDLELQGARVYIILDSKSLGDTLAWIPYVEEFRKKHNCKVICSTFWNSLFENKYPDIQFVNPGTSVDNLIAMYYIGLYYTSDGIFDSNKHRNNPMNISLQQYASDILGLEYTEIRPLIVHPTPVKDTKQITIGIHSTAQAKYWNNPTGWQEVVDWLHSKGYTVKLLSKEGDEYMGNKAPTGIVKHPTGPIELVMEELLKSDAFIGIGSGLSWLSWTLGIPTVLISGFSYRLTEMQDCIRISAPTGKCSGCWNRHTFDRGDWNWCPDQKNTPRQFECSKSITSEMVIGELKKVLNIE